MPVDGARRTSDEAVRRAGANSLTPRADIKWLPSQAGGTSGSRFDQLRA